MSAPAAVIGIGMLLTLCGLGALAVLGVATSWTQLARRSGAAPLAGMAWAGIVAATLATAGFRLGIAGLLLLTAATCAGGIVRLLHAAPVPSERRRPSLLDAAVSFVALIIVVIVVAAAVPTLRVLPLIEYDAWAMWGMKARAIAVLGSADPDLFASDAYARLHIEYPLLLPALHALPLQAADGYTSNTVVLSCLAIGLAGLLGLWGIFRDRVRPALLLPAVAAIAAAPAYFGQLATGYADVPLAVFVACGLGAAGRWLVDRDTSWLALATLFLSAGVLTKNEGLVFAAAVFLPLLVVARGRRRAVAVAGLACALLYGPWRAFIAYHDIESPQNYELSTLLDLPTIAGRLDRVPVTVEGLLNEAFAPGQFGLLLAVGIAAAALGLLLGARPLAVLAAGFLVLSFAGIVWAYVVAPDDVDIFLSSNADRIVVSLIAGLAALSPLLVEESVRALDARRGAVVAASR